MRQGSLYLIPSPLSGAEQDVIPANALSIARRLATFVVENEKTARATLKRYGYPAPLQSVNLLPLNEHSHAEDLRAALAPLLAGEDVGLMSEAGCPAVADPGADLVRLAHQHGIRVVPLIGPSSIMLALMASGLDGQRFAFCGYLPAERDARIQALRALEVRSQHERETQIFIETPYRNAALFKALLEVCRPETLLCIASDLTGAEQSVRTQTLREWRDKPIEPPRLPTVFLLLATDK